MNPIQDANPTNPGRVRSFAIYFKNYMSISSVIVAALPIPVTSFKLIPAYASQTGLLSVYTPLFCFLTLGFIFYSRHILARLMFPDALGLKIATNSESIWRPGWAIKFTGALPKIIINLLPLLLIILSIFFMFYYYKVLIDTINYRQVNAQASENTYVDCKSLNADCILEHTRLDDIHCDDRKGHASAGESSIVPDPLPDDPNHTKFLPSNDCCSSVLIFLYIAFFVSAEAAFILMAIKEYLQDLLKFSEMDLIRGIRAPVSPEIPKP